MVARWRKGEFRGSEVGRSDGRVEESEGGRSERQHIQAGGQNMLAIELVWGSSLLARVKGTGTRDRCRWQGGWYHGGGNQSVLPSFPSTTPRSPSSLAGTMLSSGVHWLSIRFEGASGLLGDYQGVGRVSTS